jgi:hypothetical protein
MVGVDEEEVEEEVEVVEEEEEVVEGEEEEEEERVEEDETSFISESLSSDFFVVDKEPLKTALRSLCELMMLSTTVRKGPTPGLSGNEETKLLPSSQD